jgi:4-cresol dehydrogenase (hydroxylating)
VQRRLRGICDVQIMTERKVAFGIGLLSALAFVPALRRLRDTAKAVRPLLGMARGIPTDAALPSVLWPVEDVPAGPLDPDQSHSGVIYVLPAIPLDGKSAQQAVAIARGTAGELGLQCYITLNTMTDHALEGVINVAFDRRDADQVRRAQNAAERMLQRFYEAGMPPYRAGIQQMGQVVREGDPYWQTVRRLKEALDPDGVIAPGRYSL